MARLLEPLVWLALAALLHLLAAALLIRPADTPAGDQAAPVTLTMAAGETAALIASWETPPAAMSEPANLPSPPPEAAPEAPIPQLPPMTMALPSSPPVMAPAPDVAPVIASALLLQQSSRPEARPARRTAAPAAPATRQPQQAARPSREAPAAAAPTAAAPAPQASGGQAGSGQSRGDQGRGVNSQALMGDWAAQISRCIARKARAPAAAARGGQVLLNLQIGRDGRVQGIGIAASSGNPARDQAAVDAARRAGRCPAAPRGLDQASFSFQLPINPGR